MLNEAKKRLVIKKMKINLCYELRFFCQTSGPRKFVINLKILTVYEILFDSKKKLYIE